VVVKKGGAQDLRAVTTTGPMFSARLRLGPDELQGVLALIRSRVDLSLARVLASQG
jgi:hypothetical protein